MGSALYNVIKTCYLSGMWDGKEELLSMAVGQSKITEDEMKEIKRLRALNDEEESIIYDE
ncbi:hypothetical protein M3573_19110 [Bacillus safensis]|uniref:hypothetical protein n=1 Tax=Bacillus safensis TaxID=561879 RepID=UPI00203A4F25|nr:hypothetical protein [Bacillus safensis]MCM3140389.1 hypothetical protein [Bacillus safensis]